MVFTKCRRSRPGSIGAATEAYAFQLAKRTRWRWIWLAAAGLACSPIRIPPTPGASPEVVGTTISRADAIADIDTMMRILEDVHPDLYAERPRDSVSMARARIVAGLPPSMSRAELWVRLAPLTASLGDGHTSVYFPGEEVSRMVAGGARLFPPQVVQDDAGHLIVAAPVARDVEIEAGDRILSVNGLNADSLVRAWTNEVSGESMRFRVAGVTSGFRSMLLLHSIGAPYTLQFERAGGPPRRAVLAGLTQDSLRALVLGNAAGRRRTATPNFSYEKLSPGVGYMNFRTMGGDPSVFRGDVAKMFAQVGADSVQTLFIDLRSNGGGDSRLGDELLRHLTTKPYRMGGGKQWKMSGEYRTYFKTWVPAPLRWIHAWNFFGVGRQLMHGPDGKIVDLPESAEAHSSAGPFFTGNVCVLIGRQTFSSAADLADGIKTYRLATLIGEETGGRPNGFGEAYVFRLPKSQLAVSVSSARFVRASGDTSDHRGVVPDVAAGPSELAASTLSIQSRNCSKF